MTTGKPTGRTFVDGMGYLQCPKCGYGDVPSEFCAYVPPWDPIDRPFGGSLQCQCGWVDSEVAFILAYGDGSQPLPDAWNITPSPSPS